MSVRAAAIGSSFLRCAEAGLIITNNENISLASELAQDRAPLLNTDELDPGLSIEDLYLSIQPDAFAWLLYTSGSTGQPEGGYKNHSGMFYEEARWKEEE